MTFTQWLRQLSASKTQSSRATRRNKTPRPSSPRSVIKLEQLEDKIAPAILTVNSLLDNTTAGDGLVTLREAINAANNAGTVTDLGQSSDGIVGDTIQFAPSIDGGTITITMLALNNASVLGPTAFRIDNLLTIDGKTGLTQGITINRGASSPGRFRLFFVQSTADLTLDSLTLSGGYAQGYAGGSGAGSGGGGAAGMGGAIFNQGSLSILNSTLTGNTAQGGNGGSGARTEGPGNGGGGMGGAGQDITDKSTSDGGHGGGPNGGVGGRYYSNGFNGYPGQSGGGGGGGGRNEFVVSFAGLGGAGGFGGGGGGGGSDRKTAIEDDYLGSVGGDGGFGGGGGGTGLHKNESTFGINRRSGSAFGGGASTYQAGGGGAGMGGAIFNYGGDVTISNSTIASNTSIGGEGGRNYNRTDYTADNLQLRGVFGQGLALQRSFRSRISGVASCGIGLLAHCGAGGSE